MACNFNRLVEIETSFQLGSKTEEVGNIEKRSKERTLLNTAIRQSTVSNGDVLCEDDEHDKSELRYVHFELKRIIPHRIKTCNCSNKSTFQQHKLQNAVSCSQTTFGENNFNRS